MSPGGRDEHAFGHRALRGPSNPGMKKMPTTGLPNDVNGLKNSSVGVRAVNSPAETLNTLFGVGAYARPARGWKPLRSLGICAVSGKAGLGVGGVGLNVPSQRNP